jgi:tetratricopeptide (TPR) repeat protein
VSELLTRLSAFMPEKWRPNNRLRRVLGPSLPAEGSPEALISFARAMMASGQLERADRTLEETCRAMPAYANVIEAHAHILDILGQSDRARSKYETARQLRSQVRQAAPDRTFALRRRSPLRTEISEYDTIVNLMKGRLFPLIARGHAYLAEGKPNEALMDYERLLAVRPGTREAVSGKAEAFSMMGRYQEAVDAFGVVLAKSPRDTEALSGRAIALIAEGKTEAANADWRLQFDLLAEERCTARACVALRLADYEKALPELERSMVKEPGDAYWSLYRQTAYCRLGKRPEAAGAQTCAKWPAPLFAVLGGNLSEDEVLRTADTPGQQAEALFQLGAVAASKGDRERAAARWQDVLAVASPDLIEYAAARNELHRIRS